MTITSTIPPSTVQETFVRAMQSLTSHPEYVHGDGRYQFLPPLKRLLLRGGDARDRRIEASEGVGWQYLIHDNRGLAIVDLSDDTPETYSSVRRGPFASRYEEILRTIGDLEVADGQREELFALEVPQFGTSAFALQSNEIIRLFPISLRGALQPFREIDRWVFFAALLEPSPPPKRNIKHDIDGPII